MLVSIIIIKLVINLISRSAYYCVLKLKICSAHSLVNLKMYIKSHKKH